MFRSYLSSYYLRLRMSLLLCILSWSMHCVYYFFFFQAKDGIRDAQESLGLGDVYKRQGKSPERRQPPKAKKKKKKKVLESVSYTLLTLPTILRVKNSSERDKEQKKIEQRKRCTDADTRVKVRQKSKKKYTQNKKNR